MRNEKGESCWRIDVLLKSLSFLLFPFSFNKSLFGSAFQRSEHKLPIFFNTGDEATFVGCVGRTHCGAEAHHVHLRIFCSDDTAFQTCVDDLHLAVGTEEFFVNVLHERYDFAFGIGLPSGISTVELNLHASHREYAFERFRAAVAHAVARRANEHLEHCLSASDFNNGEV